MAAVDEDFWTAVSEAVETIMNMETKLTQEQLVKRVGDHVTKAIKGVSLRGRPLDEVVNEYTDNVYGSVFQAFSDKDWLMQLDLLLVIDVAIKQLFPAPLVSSVDPGTFEQVVLAANDRAFDEGRYQFVSWEIITGSVQGPKTKKKVRESVDEGRTAAVQSGVQSSEEFLQQWVSAAIAKLGEKTQGSPSMALPLTTAVQLFDQLMQAGCLPLTLTESEGLPPHGWPSIEQYLTEAYAAFPEDATDDWSAPAPVQSWKGSGKGAGKGCGSGKSSGKGSGKGLLNLSWGSPY